METQEKLTIPWQRRQEIGFFKSLWETIKQVLFKPRDFFENLEIQDGYSEPFYFYLAIAIPVLLITVAYGMLFGKGIRLPQTLLALVLVPLLIFISTLLMHLAVMIFRGKGGLRGTFNVLAYSSAARIFDIIPFAGVFISFIWGLIIAVIGYKRVHKFSTPKAFFAYAFIPILMFVIVLFAAVTIPNLLKSRLAANETTAQETLRTLSKAAESYAYKNNGNYPKGEYDLKLATPPYIAETYNNKTINGYQYSVNFSANSYEIIAAPLNCGITGNRIFIIETQGKESEKGCQ